jgi:hypothetical protein
MVSRSGTERCVLPARRVRTTDCETPGTVSSQPAAAAVADIEETPGTISNERSLARHHATCSATAL